MTVAVIIATMGRSAELQQSIAALNEQTRKPNKIVVSAVNEGDVGDARSFANVVVILGPAGSCVQRNRALDHLAGTCDIICFFDDDYLPSRYALEGIVRLFLERSEIAGVTGRLLADGINSPGISFEAAQEIISIYDRSPRQETYTMRHSRTGLYGCNMAFREASIFAERFDECLPLYGWQEDIDFATRVSRRGLLVWTDVFTGVHRGVKKGRSSGLRVGYSQIANPVYLVRKGTMPLSFALKIVLKNIIANSVKASCPEPWLDRWGRMRGNFRALLDLARGRLAPSRILDMK